MTTKRHHVAGKWSVWCADCGAKNHKNASECKRCGYGDGQGTFGVGNKQNVGDPRYTSDGEAGKYNRSVDTGKEHCPDCECELVHGHDRYNYEVLQCPGCAKWKRPSWDDLREPPEGGF